ncbi:hypothetical protein BS47DRAFT_1390002 [Hydnum rufescens UP504]|uniref:Uncharacterized protein n=1 Tax=Hydnum rufescens UP504 TaxID=1448309 RepID=A0A9P6B6I9_9AGAM|nr:hypothetical protein BS47DRAFT_1390002 [Hydnum rufescens UP504]
MTVSEDHQVDIRAPICVYPTKSTTGSLDVVRRHFTDSAWQIHCSPRNHDEDLVLFTKKVRVRTVFAVFLNCNSPLVLASSVPSNEPGDSFKMEWAATHRSFSRSVEQSTDHLLVYTDRSLTVEQGVRRTGTAGFSAITYYQDQIVRETFGALGQKAEVYDAEMEALAAIQQPTAV